MSNIDNAKLYAEGKVAEALKQVVADAYMAGYNAGYQDGVDKVAKDSALEGVEYVDLGLPSGTLWASDYVKDGDEVLFLPYPEALKYNIPTEEQVDELQSFVKSVEKVMVVIPPTLYLDLMAMPLRLRDMVICILKILKTLLMRIFGKYMKVIIPKRYKYLISITRKVYIRPLFLEDTEYQLEL